MGTKRGRPPLDPKDRSVKLTIRVSPRDYDDAQARATAKRVSISEWVRRTMRDASG